MVTLESVYDPEFPKETPSNNPLVSVIIPTNQRPLKLCSALMAIADQKYSNFEVIVVYTPDSRTERVLDWFSSETPLELSYIEQRGGGSGQARNLGIEAANGDIIAFTDDDCIPPEKWLLGIVRTFEKYDVISVGGIDFPHPSVSNRLAAEVDIERKRRNQIPDTNGVVLGGFELRTFGASNVAYDVSVFEDFGVRYDPAEYRDNDALIQKRAFEKTGKQGAYIPIPVLHTRDYTFEGMAHQRFKNGLHAYAAEGGRSLFGSIAGLLLSPILLTYNLYESYSLRAGVGYWISDMIVRLGMVYRAISF